MGPLSHLQEGWRRSRFAVPFPVRALEELDKSKCSPWATRCPTSIERASPCCVRAFAREEAGKEEHAACSNGACT